MSSQEPSKTDVDTILKRLRTLPANKACFDCGAKNPTWSSVTYGIFICIDCSATHRSLGVHLSFVKSTQLDTNWTWLQLRAMQLGGNANAAVFFEQQNCTTKVAQQKYSSRAANLYRDKLHQAAIKAQRTYGTKLHIDEHGGQSHTNADKQKEPVDFFNEMTTNSSSSNQPEANSAPVIPGNYTNVNTSNNGTRTEYIIQEPQIDDKSHEGPSMASLSNPNQDEAPSQIKSNILAKKPAATKKKGLGAQKVTTDFKEIERAMEEQERMKEHELQQQAKNKEEQEKLMEKQMASMKLAYNNIDKQREKEEAKLMQIDPKKAQQLERLGMAVGTRTTGISHSAVSDMQIIQQDVRPNQQQSSFGASGKSRDFFDEMEGHFTSSKTSSSSTSNSNNDYLSRDSDFESSFKGFTGSSNKSDWVVVDDKFTDDTLSSSTNTLTATTQGPTIMSDINRSTTSRYTNVNSTGASSTSSISSSSSNGDATKRFANAKAISSEQYFGKNSNTSEDDENKNRLNKFQGSSSISSEDYFGDGKTAKKSSYSSGNASYATPDINAMKQDLKDGVSKVAGRLSNMASNMMSSFQDRL